MAYVIKPQVYNPYQLKPGSVYAPPALPPFYTGLRPGYTQRNLLEQYTIRQMAVSPLAVNNPALIRRIRQKHGYADDGTYEALGTIGGVVGAGVGAFLAKGKRVAAKKALSKAGSFAPYVGTGLAAASLGLSIAGLKQSIDTGDNFNTAFNIAHVVLDAADIAGDFIPVIGPVISTIATAASMGIGALQGWLVGTSIGRSFSPEGARLQAYYAQNLYSSMIQRPIASIATVIAMAAIPALISGFGKIGTGKDANKFLKVVGAVPRWLSNNAVGNQARAGISMLAIQGLNKLLAPLDDKIPWAPEDPRELNFVSAVSLYGDLNDNLYGATRNKAILKGLAEGDSNAMIDAMKRAWGFSDEMTYAINFDDVRQSFKAETNVPFLNSLISVMGEILIDPQNYYEVAFSLASRNVSQKVAETADQVLKTKQANVVVDGKGDEFSPLFDTHGFMRNTGTRVQILARLFAAKMQGGTKALIEEGVNLFSTRFKGSKVEIKLENTRVQLELIDKLFDEIITGDASKYTNKSTTFQDFVDKVKDGIENPDKYKGKDAEDILRTYNTLVQMYGTDKTDVLLGKLTDDFNLKLSPGNLQKLYHSYQAFKTHMDMSNNVASFILGVANPVTFGIKKLGKPFIKLTVDAFRRFTSSPDQVQHILIKVDDAIKGVNESVKLVQKDIDALREKEQQVQKDIDNTPIVQAVTQAVKAGTDSEKHKEAYNADIITMAAAVEEGKELNKQLEKERENMATYTYTYNKRTVVMNKKNEQELKDRIDAFEKGKTPEELAQIVASGKRNKDVNVLTYIEEKEIYNNHMLFTYTQNDGFRLVVANAQAFASLLSNIYLYAEEHRINILSNLQRARTLTNAIITRDEKDVLTDLITYYNEQLNKATDEQEHDAWMNKIKKAEAQLKKATNRKVNVKVFDTDVYNQSVEGLKGIERLLADRGFIVRLNTADGVLDLNKVEETTTDVDFIKVEVGVHRTTTEVVQGIIATTLGDKYPADFLKYKGLEPFVSKEEWDKLPDKYEYLFDYIRKATVNVLDADDVNTLFSSNKFRGLIRQIDIDLASDDMNYIIAQDLTDADVQEQIMGRLLSGDRNIELHNIMTKALDTFAHLEEKLGEFRDDLFDNMGLLAVKAYVDKFNRTLSHNRMFNYINNYFNYRSKVNTTGLSFFTKEAELREHFVDLTKYKKPIEVRQALQEIGDDDRNLLYVLYDDKQLINDLNYITYTNSDTLSEQVSKKLKTKVDGLKHMSAEDVEEVIKVTTDSADKVLLQNLAKRKVLDEEHEVKEYKEKIAEDIRNKVKQRERAHTQQGVIDDLKQLPVYALLDDDLFKNFTARGFITQADAGTYLRELIKFNPQIGVQGIVFTIREQMFLPENGKTLADAQGYTKLAGGESLAHEAQLKRLAKAIAYLVATDKSFSIDPALHDTDVQTMARNIVNAYKNGKEVNITVNKTFKTVMGKTVSVTAAHYNKVMRKHFVKHVVQYYENVQAFYADGVTEIPKTDIDGLLNDFKARLNTLTETEQHDLFQRIVKDTDEEMSRNRKVPGRNEIAELASKLGQMQRKIVYGSGQFYYTGAEDIVKREVLTNPNFLSYMNDVIKFGEGDIYETETFRLLTIVQDLLVEEYADKKEFNPEGYIRVSLNANGEYVFETQNLDDDGKHKSVSLIELMVRFRVNRSNFSDLLDRVFEKMAQAGTSGSVEVAVADARAQLMHRFDELFEELGSLISFNRFDISEEAYSKHPSNQGLSPAEIKRKYKILSNSNLASVYDMLMYRKGKTVEFRYYKPLLDAYDKVSAAQVVDNKFKIGDREFRKGEESMAVLYQIITDKTLDKDLRKSLLLDVFFHDMKTVRGAFDQESIDKYEQQLAIEENKKSPDRTAQAYRRANIRRLKERIKVAKAEQAKFKYTEDFKEQIYKDVIENNFDFDFIMDIFKNKVSKKAKNTVVAFDPVNNVNVIAKRYIYEDNQVKENVELVTKGLPGWNSHIIEFIFADGVDTAEKRNVVEGTSKELLDTYLHDYKVKASGTRALIVTVDNPKIIKTVNELRDALQKVEDGYKDIFVVTEQQYDEIVGMIKNPDTFEDTPRYVLKPDSVVTNNVINVASREVLVDVIMNDLRLLSGRDKDFLDRLAEYQKIHAEGAVKVPTSGNVGVSFTNSKLFTDLRASAQVHLAYLKFLKALGDPTFSAYNIEKLSLMYFNDAYIKGSEEITLARLKQNNGLSNEMLKDLDRIKINGETLGDLLVKSLQALRAEYKDSIISFDFKDILSKQTLTTMSSIETNLRNIIRKLYTHYKSLEQKIGQKAKYYGSELEKTYTEPKELEAFFHENSRLMIVDGYNILKSKDVIEHVRNLKRNYSRLSIVSRTNNEERVKHFNAKHEATQNKTRYDKNNRFQGKFINENFIEGDSDPLKLLPQDLLDEVRKVVPDADDHVRNLFDMYLNNVYNAGYFTYHNEKNPDATNIPRTVITIYYMLGTLMQKYDKSTFLTPQLAAKFKDAYETDTGNVYDYNNKDVRKYIVFAQARAELKHLANNDRATYTDLIRKEMVKVEKDIKELPRYRDARLKNYDPRLSDDMYPIDLQWSPGIINELFNFPESVVNFPPYARLNIRPNEKAISLAKHYDAKNEAIYTKVVDAFEMAMFKKNDNPDLVVEGKNFVEDRLPDNLSRFHTVHDYLESLRATDAIIVDAIIENMHRDPMEPRTYLIPPGMETGEAFARYNEIMNNARLLRKYGRTYRDSPDARYQTVDEMIRLNTTELLERNRAFMNSVRNFFLGTDIVKDSSTLRVELGLNDPYILNLLEDSETIEDFIKNISAMKDARKFQDMSELFTLLTIINRLKLMFITDNSKDKAAISYEGMIEKYAKDSVKKGETLLRALNKTGFFDGDTPASQNIDEAVRADYMYIQDALSRQRKLNDNLALIIPQNRRFNKEHTFTPAYVISKDTNIRLLTMQAQQGAISNLFVNRDNFDIEGKAYIEFAREYGDASAFVLAESLATSWKSIGSSNMLLKNIDGLFTEALHKSFPGLTDKDFVRIHYVNTYIGELKRNRAVNGYYISAYEAHLANNNLDANVASDEINKIIELFQSRKGDLFQFNHDTVRGLLGFIIESKYSDKTYEVQSKDLRDYFSERLLKKNLQYRKHIEDARMQLSTILDDPHIDDTEKINKMFDYIYQETPKANDPRLKELKDNLLNYRRSRHITIFDTRDFMEDVKVEHQKEASDNYKNLADLGVTKERLTADINAHYNNLERTVRETLTADNVALLPKSFRIKYDDVDGAKIIRQESLDEIQEALRVYLTTNRAEQERINHLINQNEEVKKVAELRQAIIDTETAYFKYLLDNSEDLRYATTAERDNILEQVSKKARQEVIDKTKAIKDDAERLAYANFFKARYPLVRAHAALKKLFEKYPGKSLNEILLAEGDTYDTYIVKQLKPKKKLHSFADWDAYINKALEEVYNNHGVYKYRRKEKDYVYKITRPHKEDTPLDLRNSSKYSKYEKDIYAIWDRVEDAKHARTVDKYGVDEYTKQALKNVVSKQTGASTSFVQSVKDFKGSLQQPVTAAEDNDLDKLRFNWYNGGIAVKEKIHIRDEAYNKRSTLQDEYAIANNQIIYINSYSALRENLQGVMKRYETAQKNFEDSYRSEKVKAIPYGATNIGTFKYFIGKNNELTNQQAIEILLKTYGDQYEGGIDALEEYIKERGERNIHNPVIDTLITYANMMHINPGLSNFIVFDMETVDDDAGQAVPYQITLLTRNDQGQLRFSTVSYSSHVFYDKNDDGSRGPLLEKFYQQQKKMWNANNVADHGVELSEAEIEKRFDALIEKLKFKSASVAEVNSMMALLSENNKTIVTHNGKKYDREVYQRFTESFTKRHLLNIMDRNLREITPESILARAGVTENDDVIKTLEQEYRRIIVDVQSGKYTSNYQLKLLQGHVDRIIRYLVERRIIADIIAVENETGYVLKEDVRDALLDPESGVMKELADSLFTYFHDKDALKVYGLFERGLAKDHTADDIKDLRTKVDVFLATIDTRYKSIMSGGSATTGTTHVEGLRRSIINELMKGLNIQSTEFKTENLIEHYQDYIDDLNDRLIMVTESLDQDETNKLLVDLENEQQRLGAEKQQLSKAINDLQVEIIRLGGEQDASFALINKEATKLGKLIQDTKRRVNMLLNSNSQAITNNYINAYGRGRRATLVMTKENAYNEITNYLALMLKLTEAYQTDPDKLFDPSVFNDPYFKNTADADIKAMREMLKLLEPQDNADAIKALGDDLELLYPILNFDVLDKNTPEYTYLEKYLMKDLLPTYRKFIQEKVAYIKERLPHLGIKPDMLDPNDIATWETVRSLLTQIPREEQSIYYKDIFDLFKTNSDLRQVWDQADALDNGKLTLDDILGDNDLAPALIEHIKQSIAAKEFALDFLNNTQGDEYKGKNLNREFLLSLFKTISTRVITEKEFEEEFNSNNIFNVLHGRKDPSFDYDVIKKEANTFETDEDNPDIYTKLRTRRLYKDPFGFTDRHVVVPTNKYVLSKGDTYYTYDNFNDSVFTLRIYEDEETGEKYFNLSGTYYYRTYDNMFTNKTPEKVSINVSSLDDLNNLLLNFYDKEVGIKKGIALKDIVTYDGVDHSYNAFKLLAQNVKNIMYGGEKTRVIPLNKIVEEDGLEVINITERASKEFIERVKAFEKYKNDFANYKLSNIGYQTIYNEVMGAYDRLPGNTFEIHSPKALRNRMTLKLDDKMIAKYKMNLLDVTEATANKRARGINPITYEPAFREHVNPMRSLLSYPQMRYLYSSIDVLNDLYRIDKDRAENISTLLPEEQKRIKQQAESLGIDLNDISKVPPALKDKAIELQRIHRRNAYLIRNYNDGQIDVFTPNIVTERTYQLYKDDMLHKVGFNASVAFINDGRAYEDVILMDAERGRQLWSKGYKTWIDDAGFKGAIKFVENLEQDYGATFVVSKSSVLKRGSETLLLKAAFNNIRKFLVGEDTSDISTEAMKLLKDHEQELRDLIGEGNIRDGKLVVDPLKNYGRALNKILGTSYHALISHKPQDGLTFSFKKPDGSLATVPITDDIYRGELYIIMDSSHRTELMANESATVVDGDLTMDLTNVAGSIQYGFLLSLTAMAPVVNAVGVETYNKLFPLNPVDFSEYVQVREHGIVSLINIKKDLAQSLKGLNIKDESLRKQAFKYLNIYFNKDFSKEHKAKALEDMNNVSKNAAHKRMTDGAGTLNYSETIRRVPGIRAQVLADTDLDLGTVRMSKEQFEYMYARNPKLIKEEVAKDWNDRITYTSKITGKTYNKTKANNVTFDSLTELKEYETYLNSQGIHNVGTKTYTIDGLKITFHNKLIKYAHAMVVRSPVQNYRAVPIVKVIGFHDHHALEASPYIYPMMGMDNDGDAVNLTAVDPNIVANEAAILDASKEGYYKDGYLKEVMKDLGHSTTKFFGTGIEYNARGNKTFSKFFRPNMNNLPSELIRASMPELFDALLKDMPSDYIKKEAHERFKELLKEFDMQKLNVDELLIYFDAATRSARNGDFIDTEGLDRIRYAIKIRTFARSTNQLEILYDFSPTKLTQYIGMLYAFDKLYEEYDEELIRIFTPTESMYNNNRQFLRTRIRPVENDYEETIDLHKRGDDEATKYLNDILKTRRLNELFKGTTLRADVSKALIGLVGGGRRPLLLSAQPINLHSINNNPNFFKSIGATFGQVYGSRLKYVEDDVTILSILKSLGSTHNDIDDFDKADFSKDPMNWLQRVHTLPITPAERDYLYTMLLNAINNYTLAKKEIGELQELFLTMPTLNALKDFLRHSSKINDSEVQEILQLPKGNGVISKQLAVSVLSMYFGENVDLINRTLKDSKSYSAEAIAKTYITQYVIDANTTNELDEFIQEPISLAKHGDILLNFHAYKEAINERMNKRVKGKAVRRITVGTGRDHYLQKANFAFAYAYDNVRFPLVEDTPKEDGIGSTLMNDHISYDKYYEELMEYTNRAFSFALFGNIPEAETANASKVVQQLFASFNKLLEKNAFSYEDIQALEEIIERFNSMGITLNNIRRGIKTAQTLLYQINTRMVNNFPNEPQFSAVHVPWLSNTNNIFDFIQRMYNKKLKQEFLLNAGSPIISDFVLGELDDELKIRINTEDGAVERFRDSVEYMEDNIQQTKSLLGHLFNEIADDLTFTQRRVATQILNNLNMLTLEGAKSIEDAYKEVKQSIMLLFKLIDLVEEDVVKAEGTVSTKELQQVREVNKYVYATDRVRKLFEALTEEYNKVVKNKHSVEEKSAHIQNLNAKISAIEDMIQQLKSRKEGVETLGDKQKIIDDLKELIKDREGRLEKNKEKLLTAAIYETLGPLIMLLRDKNNYGFKDTSIYGPPKMEPIKRTLTQEDVDKVHRRNLLQMDNYQIPFLTQASFFNNNWEEMYDWLKDSNFRVTKLQYAFDYETLARKFLHTVLKDESMLTKKNKTRSFKTIDDLINYVQDMLKADAAIYFDHKPYHDIDPLLLTKHADIPSVFKGTKEHVTDITKVKDPQKDTLYIVDKQYYTWNGQKFVEQFGIDQYITPTLKEVWITKPEQLKQIYDHIVNAQDTGEQYVYGLTTTDDMMSAMEKSYRYYQLEGKFKNFVLRFQTMQKLTMRLSIGFLFRNMMDTFHQLHSELMYEQGFGGTVLSTREILKYGGMSMEVYDIYQTLSEERYATRAAMFIAFEEIEKRINKGPLNTEDQAVVDKNIAYIMERLESYVAIAGDVAATEGTSTLKRRLPIMQELLAELTRRYADAKAKPVLLNRFLSTLKRSVTEFGNISFAEFFLLYDNYTFADGRRVAGLRVDAYDVHKNGRTLKNDRTLKEKYSNDSRFIKRNKLYYEDFRDVLFDISAFMNTNAQIDQLKRDEYKNLKEIIQIHRSKTPLQDENKTYEEILKELELEKEKMTSKFSRTLSNIYGATYENGNEYIENAARITAYLYDKFINAYGHEEIIQRSLKRWFNYGMRDPIETRLLADIPYLSFPLRSIGNWINRLFDPSYMRFMSDLIDGIYGQYADDNGRYNAFTIFQIQNGWIPITNKWGIRVGNGAFDIQNIISNPTEVVQQRTNPLIAGIRTLSETGDVQEAIKRLALTGVLTRVLNPLSALTGTRELMQETPVIKDYVSNKPASFGSSTTFTFNVGSYNKYTPKKYRYQTNGRYAKYENIYRDWFNKYGKMRRPKVDLMSLVKDIHWQQYVRYRQSKTRL